MNMKINGREVGFLYTVGAFCEISDYVVANSELSAATAELHKAVILNGAYNRAHGITEGGLTLEELEAAPLFVMADLREAMKKAEEEGLKRTVEAQEKKERPKPKA